MESKAYILTEADGTSPSGGIPHYIRVCLSKEDALAWKAALPKGSWNYRSIQEVKLLCLKENNESTKP